LSYGSVCSLYRKSSEP